MPSARNVSRPFEKQAPDLKMGVQNIEYFLVGKKGLWKIGWYMINMQPQKFLGVLQAWVNVPVCFSLAGEQAKYAFGTVVSCDHCSVPVSH